MANGQPRIGINQIDFKTSAFTGTAAKDGAGDALARVVMKSLEGAKQYQAKLKSRNGEEDRLLFMDTKIKLQQEKTKQGFEYMGAEDRTKFMDAFENDMSVEFKSEIYNKQWEGYVTSEYAGIDSVYKKEIQDATLTDVIPSLAKNYAAFGSDEDFDPYVEAFRDIGIKKPKEIMLREISSEVYAELKTGKYDAMSEKEIRGLFPVLGLIKNKDVTERVDAKIKDIQAKKLEREYANDIAGFVGTATEFNGNTYRRIKSKYGKSITEVYSDMKKSAEPQALLYLSSGDSSEIKKGVELTKQYNLKIKKVDGFIDNVLNQAQANPDTFMENYEFTRNAINNGYVPEADVRDFRFLESASRVFGIPIDSAQNVEKLGELTRDAKEKAIRPIDYSTAYKDIEDEITGIFSGAEAGDVDAIAKVYRDYSRFFPKEAALEEAIRTYEDGRVQMFGLDDNRIDYTGVKGVKSDKDVEYIEKRLKKQFKWLNIERTARQGDTIIHYFKRKDGKGYATKTWSIAELNEFINSEKASEIADIERYEKRKSEGKLTDDELVIESYKTSPYEYSFDKMKKMIGQ